MHISLDWLKDFVNIKKDLNPQDLGNMLTLKTAEVEAVIEKVMKTNLKFDYHKKEGVVIRYFENQFIPLSLENKE